MCAVQEERSRIQAGQECVDDEITNILGPLPETVGMNKVYFVQRIMSAYKYSQNVILQ